jgi:aryl-alcohol dehydrogenase-like predicted oxidoreductase
LLTTEAPRGRGDSLPPTFRSSYAEFRIIPMERTVKQRTLGRQGLTVSEIGYGSMGISTFYGKPDAEGGAAAIKRAHELGVTLFDTAEAYGWSENERILGQAVKDFRDEVVLATKFGFTRDYGFDSRPEHIREVVNNSLRDLGVDRIDLLYQHRVDPDVPIQDVVGTMKEFVDAGKVKYLGLSEAGPQTVRKAQAVHPISASQTEHSIFERSVEAVLPTLEELGIGFVAYSPLARGFLTGTAKPADQYDETDARHAGLPWFQPGNYEKNKAAVDQLTELAATKDATISQLALAWILAQRDYIVPIPGSRNPKRVEENVAAAHLHLTAEDLDRIKQILPDGAHGERIAEDAVPTWT